MAAYLFASALLSTLVSLLAGLVSCVFPFWIYFESGGATDPNRSGQSGRIHQRERIHQGLFAECNHDYTKCVAFFHNNFNWQRARSEWHISVQLLFLAGLLFLFLALLIACIRVCCYKGAVSRNLLSVLGSLTLITFLLLSSAIVVYGILNYMERRVNLSGTQSKFDWAYFSAIASSGSSVLAAVQFVSNNDRTDNRLLSHFRVNTVQDNSSCDSERLL